MLANDTRLKRKGRLAMAISRVSLDWYTFLAAGASLYEAAAAELVLPVNY